MTHELESTPLTFSLEETVLFRKGETIAELYNLSLEPEVTIQELDQYVSLRGSLMMIGEYKKKDWEGEEEFSFSGQKYVSVEPLGRDNLYQFSFNFPIDITIPKARIQNIEELDLVLDSFDYTLEDDDTLVISTEISVVGVYDEDFDIEEGKRAGEEEELDGIPYQEMIVPFPDFDEDGIEPSRTDSNQEDAGEEEMQELAIEVDEEVSNENSGETVQESETENLVARSYQEEANDVEVVDELATTPVYRSFAQPTTRSEQNEERTEKMLQSDGGENPEEVVVTDETDDSSYLQTESSSFRTKKQITYQPKEEMEKEEKRKLLLTDFFAHKEEEDKMATMRLYFVQSGDTIDEIAERYQINISSILRVNDLEGNEDLKEGELLYIPVAKSKRQDQ
ncbi:MAG: LysM peptidoglycan-binding domain-containing protein [Caldibacillus sp.]